MYAEYHQKFMRKKGQNYFMNMKAKILLGDIICREKIKNTQKEYIWIEVRKK